jgi:hypothetical protein
VFKWVLEYVNDNEPKPLKGLLAAVCEPIKQQLKRDLLKYETKREQYSEAGKRSAEARRLKKLEAEKESNEIQRTLTNVENRSTKSTVSVNVSDNVNVTDNVIKKKSNIIERKQDFKKSLLSFYPKYSKDLLNEFYSYWTEHGDKDKKMRFEKQTSFSTSRRLLRWGKNNFNNNSSETNTEFNANNYVN